MKRKTLRKLKLKQAILKKPPKKVNWKEELKTFSKQVEDDSLWNGGGRYRQDDTTEPSILSQFDDIDFEESDVSDVDFNLDLREKLNENENIFQEEDDLFDLFSSDVSCDTDEEAETTDAPPLNELVTENMEIDEPLVEIDYAAIQQNVEENYVPELDPDVEAENEELEIVVRNPKRNSKYTKEAERLMARQSLSALEIIVLLREVSKSIASAIDFPLQKYLDMYRQIYNNNRIYINFNEAGIFIYECSEIYSRIVNYAFDLTANLSVTKYDDFILPSVKIAKNLKNAKPAAIIKPPIKVCVEKKTENKPLEKYFFDRRIFDVHYEVDLPPVIPKSIVKDKDIDKQTEIDDANVILENKEFTVNEKSIFYRLIFLYNNLMPIQTSDSFLTSSIDIGLTRSEIPNPISNIRIRYLRRKTFGDYFLLNGAYDPYLGCYMNGYTFQNTRKVMLVISFLKWLAKAKENLLKTLELGINNRFRRPLIVDDLNYQTFLPTEFLLDFFCIELQSNNNYSKRISYEKKVHAILLKRNDGGLLAEKFKPLMLKTVFERFPNRKIKKVRRSMRIDRSREIIDLTADGDDWIYLNTDIKSEVDDNVVADPAIDNNDPSKNVEIEVESVNPYEEFLKQSEQIMDRKNFSFKDQDHVKLCNLTANDQRLLNCRLVLPNLLKHIPVEQINVANFSISVSKLLGKPNLYNENLFNIDKRLLLTETDFKLPNSYLVKYVPLKQNILELPETLVRRNKFFKLPNDFIIGLKVPRATRSNAERITRIQESHVELNKSIMLSSTMVGQDDSGNETASPVLQEQLNAEENNFGDISNIEKINDEHQISLDSGIQNDENISISSIDSNEYYNVPNKFELPKVSHYNVEKERINHWHRKIKPILKQSKRRNKFDIHAVSKEVLNKILQENNVTATELNNKDEKLELRPITFSDIIQQKGQKNTARYFSSLLQLINFKNISINNLNKNTEQVTGFDDIEINLLNDVQYFENNVMFSNEGETNAKSEGFTKKLEMRKKRKRRRLMRLKKRKRIKEKKRLKKRKRKQEDEEYGRLYKVRKTLYDIDSTSSNESQTNNKKVQSNGIKILSNELVNFGTNSFNLDSTNVTNIISNKQLIPTKSINSYNNNRKISLPPLSKEFDYNQVSQIIDECKRNNENIFDQFDYDDIDDDAEACSKRMSRITEFIEMKTSLSLIESVTHHNQIIDKGKPIEIVKEPEKAKEKEKVDLVLEKTSYTKSYNNKKRKKLSSGSSSSSCSSISCSSDSSCSSNINSSISNSNISSVTNDFSDKSSLSEDSNSNSDSGDSDSDSESANSSDNELNVQLQYSPKTYYNKKKSSKVGVDEVNNVKRCLEQTAVSDNINTSVEPCQQHVPMEIENDPITEKESNEIPKFSLFKNYKKVEIKPVAEIVTENNTSHYQELSSDDNTDKEFDTNPEVQRKILDSYKKNNKPFNSARTSFYDSAYLSNNSSSSSYSETINIAAAGKSINRNMPGPSGLQKK